MGVKGGARSVHREKNPSATEKCPLLRRFSKAHMKNFTKWQRVSLDILIFGACCHGELEKHSRTRRISNVVGLGILIGIGLWLHNETDNKLVSSDHLKGIGFCHNYVVLIPQFLTFAL